MQANLAWRQHRASAALPSRRPRLRDLCRCHFQHQHVQGSTDVDAAVLMAAQALGQVPPEQMREELVRQHRMVRHERLLACTNAQLPLLLLHAGAKAEGQLVLMRRRSRCHVHSEARFPCKPGTSDSNTTPFCSSLSRRVGPAPNAR